MKPHKIKRLLGNIGFGLSVFALISPAILVFLWMISLSFKNELDNTAYPPVFIPSSPTFGNFIDVFEKNDFVTWSWEEVSLFGRVLFEMPWPGGYLYNSIVVSFSATGLALLVGVAGGDRARRGPLPVGAHPAGGGGRV
jgi:multiple sugar transport system permease protein